MNRFMVRRLIHKDWTFFRPMVFLGAALGAVALAAIAFGGQGGFYVGSVLLITVVLGMGMHLAMATVIYERKEQTLPFVMSLPISVVEYTAAKILANLLIFLLPWLAVSAGTIAVLAVRDVLPDGLIPLATIVLVQAFLVYCVILGVALVSESEGWTIVGIVGGPLVFNSCLYYIAQLLKGDLQGAEAVWSPAVFTILAVEVGLIVLVLVLTFFLQGRKRDFH